MNRKLELERKQKQRTAREPWRNRIVGHGEQPAAQFLANPLNFRIHPKAQRSAIVGVMEEVGWVQSVVVNKTTGHVLDGHARIEEAMKLGDETPVPFIEVELTEDEEAKILATLDPIGAMAAVDKAQLDALLHEVTTESAALQQLLSDLAEENGIIPPDELSGGGEGEEPTEVPLAERAFDMVFPSDNEWGIPTLLPQAALAGLPMPCERWGRYARGSFNGGTLHFYTDDARFETIWETPEKIVMSQCKAILEPNVSTGSMTPRAFVLWGIYRKRWISRWVQQYGVAVFVDLNVEPEFRELNLLGVPRGWTHYATRGYDTRFELLDADYRTACEHADGKPVVFVVVGGGKATHAKCREAGWVHVPQEAHAIEGRYSDG